MRNSLLDTQALHEAFLGAIGAYVLEHSDIESKPLEVTCRHPLPRLTRLYLFNLTHPPGGRTLGEHKIQIIVPGQARGERGQFDHSGGYSVLLAGYESELDVFVLWDAGLYPLFAYSGNVQVKPETVFSAYAGEICTQERRIRGTGLETLVACRADRLTEAIQMRVRLSLRRLVGAESD